MVDIPGVENLSFEFNLDGPGAGSPVNVQLTSPDLEILSAASKELADTLRTMPSLTAIDNSFSSGKSQLDYKLLPEGRALGLTSNDIGRQLRSAFWNRSHPRANWST